MNAMWNARFLVKFTDRENTEFVSLMSPDLRDTREAKRRATKTARERLEKRLRKVWGERPFKLIHLETNCVG